MITLVLHLLRLFPFFCGGRLSFAKTSAGR